MNYFAKNYKKETFNEYASYIIGGYKDIIEVLGAIIEVGKNMDGKCLNKRFVTAINEKVSPIAFLSMDDQYNIGYRSLHIYIEKRSFNDKSGRCIYFDDQVFCRYINNVEATFCNMVDYNWRISSDKIEASCSELIETCHEYIDKWRDASDHFDEYTEQIKNAVREFGKLLQGLNDLFCPSEICKYDWEKAVETAEKAAKKK